MHMHLVHASFDVAIPLHILGIYFLGRMREELSLLVFRSVLGQSSRGAKGLLLARSQQPLQLLRLLRTH